MKRSSIALAVVLMALAAAPSAFAHAILQESTPSNDMVVRQSPPTVTLRFNEAVETAFGSIRVFSCDGARVDSGKVSRPDDRMVAVKLDRQLPRGSYTVTWRVISADAHPVAGAFVFHVKAADPSGSCTQEFGKGTPGEIDALFKFARALDFALILLVVGGAAALALVLRSAAAELRARLYRILAGLAVGVVFAGILCIVLQGAVAGGFGLSEAFRWNTVDSVLQTHFGKAFLFQLAFAAVTAPVAFIAGQARNAALGAMTLVPALCLLPTLSSAGHARTSGTVALVADLIHLAAASTWVGGLAFTILALLLAGDDRWPLAARAVPRFSILAVHLGGHARDCRSDPGLRGAGSSGHLPSRLASKRLGRRLAHDLRSAAAGEDPLVVPLLGARRLQQPLRRPETTKAGRIGRRATAFPASGRRGAAHHGDDRRGDRGARHRAAGEGLDQAAEALQHVRPARQHRAQHDDGAGQDRPNVIHIYTFTQSGVPAPTPP